MGIGVGVRVVGVCGLKVTPLASLPVQEVEQTLLPPWCVLAEVGLGCPPCANFSQRYLHMMDGVRGIRPKFSQGLPLRGGIIQVGRGPR